MYVDTSEFTRLAQALEGSLSLEALQRIDAAQRAGALDWKLDGFVDADGRAFMRLRVKGSVVLTCQRCMAAMQQEVSIDRNFLVAGTDAEADAVPLDQDAFDVVVGSPHFDVDALVEDEVILSLPSVPKHERCPTQVGEQGNFSTGVKDSPFAVLKGFKTKAGS